MPKSDSAATSSDSESSNSSASSSSTEPLFKYSRISQFPRTFFHKDPVSCVLASRRLLAVGTHSGVLHLANHNLEPLRTTRVHRASIADIDASGVHLATASIDGTVVIASLDDPQDVQPINLHRPVHAVALDPQYAASRSYLSGGTSGAVTLSTRGWLKTRSEMVLDQSAGTIVAVRWCGERALWCSEEGITLYDTASSTVLNRLDRPAVEGAAQTLRPVVWAQEKLEPETAAAISSSAAASTSAAAWFGLGQSEAQGASAGSGGTDSEKSASAGAGSDPVGSLLGGSSSSSFGASSFGSQASPALVAWGSHLYILDLASGAVLKLLKTVWTIAGIAPFDDEHIVLLCCEPQEPPELRVVDLDGNETYVDEVSMQGYERLGPQDYHLQAVDTTWYVISATDGIIARMRDAKDHIDWLMEEGEYHAAYRESQGVLSDDERLNIGLKAATALVDAEQWPQAADVLGACLPATDTDQWREWAQKFIESGNYVSIGKVIPKTELGSVHTDIIMWCIDHSEIEALAQFLLTWDTNLLDKSKIVRKLERVGLDELLARFYLRLSEPYNAVKSYLRVGAAAAFTVVVEHHLWNDMVEELPEILQVGAEGAVVAPDDTVEDPNADADDEDDKADKNGDVNGEKNATTHNGSLDTHAAPTAIVSRINALVASHLEISPHRVIARLQREPSTLLLFYYLRQLSLADEFLVRDFGDLIVELYAEHDPAKLLNFLTVNGTYNLNRAVEICEKRGLTNELIYLYGRVGQAQKALNLIINELGDAQRAVEFAADHKDEDLWDYLITYSRDKPEFVLQLLQCPQVPPQKVLEAVPHTLRIPGLKGALNNVLLNQKAMLYLNEGVLRIVKSEAQGHLNDLQRARKEGHGVGDEQVDWSEVVLVGVSEGSGSRVRNVYGAGTGVSGHSAVNGHSARVSRGDSWLTRKVQHLGELMGSASIY